MIFIDSTIPMYLVGADHPHKRDAQRLLDAAVTKGLRLVTDAEVFQEILHRYCAIQRREAIAPAFDVLFGIVDDVLPVDRATVEAARAIVLSSYRLSARDAIHVAAMTRAGLSQIMSFDGGFDAQPGVTRVH